MDELKIGTLKKGPLSTQVYEMLKESIIKGDIKPGARLTEKTVVDLLEVSSTPVREAFRKLSNDGLIEMIPYKGVKVKEIDVSDLIEAYSCRAMFEKHAIRLSIENYTPDYSQDLNDILLKSKNSTTKKEYVNFNTEFHDRILKQAGNSRLESFFRQLDDIIIHNRMHSSYSDERKSQINAEHEGIIEAIKNLDIELAEKRMEQHIVNGFEYMKKVSTLINADK
jgi:DNA-binding GntR family transcriptional regulator